MASIRPRNMYTEEKLRPAVAASASLSEVLAHLGLEDTAERRRYVSLCIKKLGLDRSHLRPTAQLYTDADITEAVTHATSMVEVAMRLGATPVGGTLHHLRRRITLLGLDTSHFHSTQGRSERVVVDEQTLRAVVPTQYSVAGVVRALGLEFNSKRHQVVRDTIERLGLDVRHFRGQGHLRGQPGRGRLSPEEILRFRPDQHYRRDTARIRRALTETGMSETCAGCGTGPSWQGRPMTLEVDHINGDFRDDRRENLRLLCPNCHATTSTYCRKKRVG